MIGMTSFRNNPAIYFVLYRVGIQPPLTQTTSDEQRCLKSLAQNCRQLVEIGVWHGVNTRLFRQVMLPTGVLYAVDPFPRGRIGIQWEKLIAHREASQEANGEVRWLEDYSEHAIVAFTTMTTDLIDFLFIDGDHSYEGVQKDWTLWSPHVAIGGYVALHDSRSYPGRAIEHCGAARFTREVICYDKRFHLCSEVDSLSVFQRRN